MSAPKVLVTKDANQTTLYRNNYQITLFRNEKEETFSFIGAELIVTRTDDDFPVVGDVDEYGYLYFMQAFYQDGTTTEVYVDPEEADIIVALVRKQTGKNVGGY
jgi:hypothetical protein